MDQMLSYPFRLRAGKQELRFSRVSGLRQERGTFIYQEGGLNERVHLLPGPARSGGTLRLEQGVYCGEDFPFYLEGERLNTPVTLEIWAESSQPKPGKIYTLTGVVVKKWEVGDLDAMQNAILIQKFELGYEHIAVTAP